MGFYMTSRLNEELLESLVDYFYIVIINLFVLHYLETNLSACSFVFNFLFLGGGKIDFVFTVYF